MKQLFDSKTGEQIAEFNDNQILHVIDIDERKKYKIKNRHFYKFYRDCTVFLENGKLKSTYIATFFKLLYLIEINKLEVPYKDGKYIKISNLPDYLGLKHRTLHNHLNVLEKQQLIKKIKIDNKKDKYVLINPLVICYGNKISKKALEEFYNSRWNTSKRG